MIRFSWVVVGAIVILDGSAFAQGVSEVVEGAGIKVGEGTVLHPVLGVETGIVYNVFYEEGGPGSEPNMSALLRLTGEFAVGSLPAERMQAPMEQDESTRNFGDFAFRADLRAQYEEYLSSNDSIRAQHDLALAFLARGLINPRQTWQLAFTEDFRRETRPVNFEASDDVDRDINRVGLELRYRPEGRALSGSFRYQNTIDYFEDADQQFANRLQHTFGLQVGWQWLPVTRLYGDFSLGFAGGLGASSTRPSSMPLRLNLGIQTALTVKSSLNGKIGFSKGFYGSGPDFTNVTGGLQLGYRLSPQSRVSAMYEYDFQDSINANFYRDHAIKLMIDQHVDRFAFSAAAEVRFRLYRGVIMEVMGTTPDRADLIFAVPLSASYNFRDWIAATADYRFVTDQTDFRYIPTGGSALDDPSYTRHSLMVGVRAAY